MTSCIAIRDGAVYLPATVANTYFAGIGAVVILIRDGLLMICPVHTPTAGGCLLKLRNAAGDRVVRAPDVFQAHGLNHWQVDALPVRWSQTSAALCAQAPADLTGQLSDYEESMQIAENLTYNSAKMPVGH